MVNFELPWTQKFSLSHARDKTKKRKYFAMVRHPRRKGTTKPFDKAHGDRKNFQLDKLTELGIVNGHLEQSSFHRGR